MGQYLASLAITTHNRRDELPRAVDSALAQSLGERLEIVIVDDGSKDGTSEMLAERYGHLPNVRLDRQFPGIGLIAERNRFPELCSGPVIFSMDDDAVFESPRSIKQTLAEFDADPRVGAIAMPYIDVLIKPGVVRQRCPEPGVAWAAEQYRGTAHALRKDVFVKVGRYRGQLWRQGEEQDLCIRMLDAGYVVLLGSADPLHHLESPKRSKAAIDRFTARNNLWYAWHNTPASKLAVHLAGATANMVIDGVKHPSRLGPRVQGVWQAYAGMLGKERRERRPVSEAAYRLSRRLRKGGPVRLATLDAELAALREAWERRRASA